jgi:predicted O-methyltransferase YrrM
MNRKAECLLQAASELPQGATVVEIGCVRSVHEIATDGHSTAYLAEAAKAHGWKFHSVDCNPDAIGAAEQATNGGVTLHCKDGADWLVGFQGSIDLLYLDGSSDPEEALWQYEAASLAPEATVVIDDIQPIGHSQQGKGDALLGLLEDDGFTVSIYDTEPGYRMAVAKR